MNAGSTGDILFDGAVGSTGSPLGAVSILNARGVSAAGTMVVASLTQSAGAGTDNFVALNDEQPVARGPKHHRELHRSELHLQRAEHECLWIGERTNRRSGKESDQRPRRDDQPVLQRFSVRDGNLTAGLAAGPTGTADGTGLAGDSLGDGRRRSAPIAAVHDRCQRESGSRGRGRVAQAPTSK
ncbi:MAG: hypothetical protein WDO24_14935 [Pseudomonadota bacterium]